MDESERNRRGRNLTFKIKCDVGMIQALWADRARGRRKTLVTMKFSEPK